MSENRLLTSEEWLEVANSFLEAKSVDEVYQNFASRIKDVSGAGYILISSRRPEDDFFRMKHLLGVEGQWENALKLIGFDPRKVTYPLQDMPIYADGRLGSHKLLPLKDGLYEVVSGKIPKPVCQAIEKLLGITSLYTIGLAWKEDLFGIASFGFVDDQGPRDINLIEALVMETTTALRHLYAEEAARSSNLRYRRLFESAKEGILILDYETGEIVDVNPYLTEMLDLPAKEFIGKYFWDLAAFKNIAASKNTFDKLQNSGELRSFDLTLEMKHGKKIKAEFVSNTYLVNYRKVLQCNIRDLNERWLALEGIKTANDCFVNFGTDPVENLKLITTAIGEILNATSAFYNRQEGELLVTVAGWNLPPDMPLSGQGEGHICLDVIGQGGDVPIVVSDLQNSEKYKNDPSVKKYGLQTYVGYPVKLAGESIASLCAVFKNKVEIEPYKLALIEVLGRAAGVEEERLRSEGELKKKVKELEVFYKAAMGREDKILELKQEIKTLREQSAGR